MVKCCKCNILIASFKMTQCFGLKYLFTGFKTCIVSTSFYTVKPTVILDYFAKKMSGNLIFYEI